MVFFLDKFHCGNMLCCDSEGMHGERHTSLNAGLLVGNNGKKRSTMMVLKVSNVLKEIRIF